MARPVDPLQPPAIAAADAALLLRHAREAAALRENLRRRKQQGRARRQPAPADPVADQTGFGLPQPPSD